LNRKNTPQESQDWSEVKSKGKAKKEIKKPGEAKLRAPVHKGAPRAAAPARGPPRGPPVKAQAKKPIEASPVAAVPPTKTAVPLPVSSTKTTAPPSTSNAWSRGPPVAKAPAPDKEPVEVPTKKPEEPKKERPVPVKAPAARPPPSVKKQVQVAAPVVPAFKEEPRKPSWAGLVSGVAKTESKAAEPVKAVAVEVKEEIIEIATPVVVAPVEKTVVLEAPKKEIENKKEPQAVVAKDVPPPSVDRVKLPADFNSTSTDAFAFGNFGLDEKKSNAAWNNSAPRQPAEPVKEEIPTSQKIQNSLNQGKAVNATDYEKKALEEAAASDVKRPPVVRQQQPIPQQQPVVPQQPQPVAPISQPPGYKSKMPSNASQRSPQFNQDPYQQPPPPSSGFYGDQQQQMYMQYSDVYAGGGYYDANMYSAGAPTPPPGLNAPRQQQTKPAQLQQPKQGERPPQQPVYPPGNYYYGGHYGYPPAHYAPQPYPPQYYRGYNTNSYPPQFEYQYDASMRQSSNAPGAFQSPPRSGQQPNKGGPSTNTPPGYGATNPQYNYGHYAPQQHQQQHHQQQQPAQNQSSFNQWNNQGNQQ